MVQNSYCCWLSGTLLQLNVGLGDANRYQLLRVIRRWQELLANSCNHGDDSVGFRPMHGHNLVEEDQPASKHGYIPHSHLV